MYWPIAAYFASPWLIKAIKSSVWRELIAYIFANNNLWVPIPTIRYVWHFTHHLEIWLGIALLFDQGLHAVLARDVLWIYLLKDGIPLLIIPQIDIPYLNLAFKFKNLRLMDDFNILKNSLWFIKLHWFLIAHSLAIRRAPYHRGLRLLTNHGPLVKPFLLPKLQIRNAPVTNWPVHKRLRLLNNLWLQKHAQILIWFKLLLWSYPQFKLFAMISRRSRFLSALCRRSDINTPIILVFTQYRTVLHGVTSEHILTGWWNEWRRCYCSLHSAYRFVSLGASLFVIHKWLLLTAGGLVLLLL